MQFEMDHPQAGTSSDREGDERRPFLLLSRSYSKPACRICLTDDDTDEKNLLISPCKCIGTQSYVHFDCLAKWIQQSHKRRCQICKSRFAGLIWEETSPTICQSLWRSKPATKIKLIYFLTWFVVILWLSLQVYIHSESTAYTSSMASTLSCASNSTAAGKAREVVNYNSMIGLLASFTFFYTIAMLLIWMTWVKRQLAKKAKADVTVVGHLFVPSNDPKIGQLRVVPSNDLATGSPVAISV